MILEKLQTNSSAKGAFPISLLGILYINQKRSRNSQHKICKEAIFTIPVVIYTKKDFYMIDALNNKIGILKAAGLIEFWHLKDLDKGLLNVKESNDPKVLKMEYIIGSFYVLLLGCLACIFIFLIELLVVRF